MISMEWCENSIKLSRRESSDYGNISRVACDSPQLVKKKKKNVPYVLRKVVQLSTLPRVRSIEEYFVSNWQMLHL